MDPTRPLQCPVAEVRAQAPVHVDDYGETWMVIDGIETKVPNIKAARALLDQQDATRLQIRADLDALGIRDRTEKVSMTVHLDDGTVVTSDVDLLPPGDLGANILQIGHFGDTAELYTAAQTAQDKLDAAKTVVAKSIERERLATRSLLAKIRDAVLGFLRKD